MSSIALKLTIDSPTSAHSTMLEGCLAGNALAQRKLYETYYGKMMAICMRYTNNREEARDILHEGFMKVYKNLHLYEPHRPLEVWIKKIMINTAIDHYRKNKKEPYHVDIDQAYTESDPSHISAIHQISAEEIIKLVQELSPAYRTVFNLYVIEGYSHNEIAEMLGINVGTSKSNLAKARQRLQELIKTKLPDYDYSR